MLNGDEWGDGARATFHPRGHLERCVFITLSSRQEGIFLFEKVEKIRQKHAVELSERSFDDATDVPPFITP